MSARFLCIALVVLFSAVGIAVGGPARKRTQYDPSFYAPSDKVVTPHIPWAKPYAQGKVKVLIICPRDAMREVVELSQRLSIEYAAVFTEGRSKLGESGLGVDASWKAIAGNAEEEIADDLRSKLRDSYDAIIIGHLDWSILPIDARYEILRAVKAGTGMLLVGVGKPDSYLPEVLKRKGEDAGAALVAGFPFHALPPFAKEKDGRGFQDRFIKSAQLGRGRILTLHGGHQRHFLCPGKANPDEPQIDYDYYLSLAIRGILWVARKEPTVIVAPELAVGARLDRAELAQKGLDFLLTNQGQPSRVDVQCVIRERQGRDIWTNELRGYSLEAGQSRVKFSPPAIPAGAYFADLFLAGGGKAISWGTCFFEVSSPHFISEIKLEKDSFAQAEPIRGRILIGRCVAGQEIILTQVDNWRRIVAEQRIALRDDMTEAPFEIKPASPPLTIIQYLQARLVSGGDTLDGAKVEFAVNDLYDAHDDFQFVMWASVFDNSFLDRAVWRVCREYGCDTFYTGNPLMSALRENLRFIPYSTRFTDIKTDWYQAKMTRVKGDLIRDPCLTDPAYRDQMRKDLLAKCEKYRKYSVHEVSLGDECLYVAGPWDLCFSPTCIKDFQEYVKTVYGDIARLNAQYGTQYKDWSEVKPLTLDEARQTRNPSPWVDHRLHKERLWASFHGYARQCVREVMPFARVGHEGSNTELTSFQAGDLWQLMRHMDFNCVYVRPWTVHQLRDFADPGIMTGYWYGGYEPDRNEPKQRYSPWFALLNGMNTQWEWLNYGGAGAVVAYDLTPFPFFEGAIEEIAEIKSGIGKLLINAKRRHDGVAVLYSPSSIHANTYAPVLGNTRYENVFGAWLEVTKHIGVTVRMLSYEELAKGRLNSGEFRVLILPLCQALSGQEVAEIKNFAKNGGMVIADLKAGACDEHGKPHPNTLEELFGVKMSAAEKMRTGVAALTQERSARLPALAKWSLPDTAVDEAIAVSTGTPLGQVDTVPVIIGNKYGKGHAIYLNFTLASYMTLVEKRDRTAKDYEAGAPMRDIVRLLLSIGGVETFATISPEIASADVSRFTSGAATYIGVLQALPEDLMKYTRKETPAPGAKLYTLKTAQKLHLYDVRERRYVGETNETLVSIAPARAKLFAALPYKIGGLRLGGDAEAARGGSIRYKIELQVSDISQVAPHVVRLAVLDPNGHPVSCYARNILIEKGAAEGAIPLALNDPPGQWRLHAREIVSGKEDFLRVNVTKQE